MEGTKIKAALVSTNSITQGEIVGAMWKPLLGKHKELNILFAYRTFRWDSEANLKAHVHCVIIGFSCFISSKEEKFIYSGDNVVKTNNISPYLLNSDTVLIESRSKPISDVPKMTKGNQPSDGGNLIIQNSELKDEICNKEPFIEKYIREYIGAEDYLHNKGRRYWFWLTNANPADIAKSSELSKRLDAVRVMRSNSTAEPTRQKAETPSLFFSIVQPKMEYLLIPRVSSEKRRYIPIGFISPQKIASDSCSIVPNATLYHFGILTSSVHMAWMRTVAGRLKSDYRYSGNVVYNNFIWADSTDEQKEKISKTAQAILDARALYPDSSLADLYDPLTMPPELLKAHKVNDKAVLALYGFKPDATEEEFVAKLMQMYAEKVKDSSK